MFARALAALNLRRKKLNENEKGFTLIELLVVVIIIGILAAIAIPVYLGIQANAKDSAVKSDITNAKIAVIAYQTDNSAYPTTPFALGKYGYAGSNVTYSPSGTPANTATTFCLVAPAASDTGKYFYVTAGGGVVGPVVAASKPTDC